MANLTVATLTNMTPVVWAAQFIETLRTKECLTKYVTVDSSLDVATRGRAVNFAVPGQIALADKTADTPYSLAVNANAAPVALTMAYHRAVAFVFENPAELASLMGLRNYYIEDSVGQIVEDVNAKICGLHASFTLSGVNPDLDTAAILDACGTLDTAKVPADERTIIMHPNDKIALMKELANWYLMGSGNLSAGEVPDLYGNKAAVSPQVVLSTNRKNLLIHKRAIGFGCRALPTIDPGLGAVSEVRVDSATGLIVRIWSCWDQTLGGIRVVVETLYGVCVLDATRGRLLPGAAA